ncbi:hypothetical protein L1987_42690 [Smallanthus sonchifolius]|uniref:Uncharacterized protein n=1 Tax=Smallanthus sonchifolius TaxID=185202 RepID=A0ACB9GK71_9ASTR|nr:hypothetical protein L1987_42690 [Smallanthus sonchifolius]
MSRHVILHPTVHSYLDPLTIQNQVPHQIIFLISTTLPPPVMAQNSPPSPPPAASNNPDPTRYWCYQCDERVPVETLPDHPDVICFECKNGFVESISLSNEENPAFGNEILQVLRLIAQAAREEDEPPPPPSDHPTGDNGNDYLRIELDGWDNGNYIVTNEEDQVRGWYYDDDDNEQEEEIENRNEEDTENRNDEQTENRNRIEEDEHVDDSVRRERRDVLLLRLREVASRAASRHSRMLDWADMLIGLEDQSIEFRLQVPGDDDDAYVGNPGDYVDAAGYKALLQTIAESDSSGRRGAPPAAKSTVENLNTVEVKSSDNEMCAVCKDKLLNNEGKIAKQLECGHVYHGECIVPWLSSRNTCPVCRFELPTDDAEYEEDRKRRLMAMAAATIDHGWSSSSGGGGD